MAKGSKAQAKQAKKEVLETPATLTTVSTPITDTTTVKSTNVRNTARNSSASKEERLWKMLFWIVVPFFLKIFLDVADYQKGLRQANIPHTNYSDLSLSATAGFVFYFVKHSWEKLTVPIIFPLLEDKYTGNERLCRTKRVSKWVFDFFYYSAVTIFGFIHFRTELPTLLLGSATCWNATELHPDPIDLPLMREFYLVQMGGYLYKMVDQIFKKKDDIKFWEYLLHHFLTFCLMLYSYMTNFTRVGIIIMITHDLTDIFLSSMRAQEAFRYKVPVLFPLYFVITYLVWAYCRGIVYPFCSAWTTMVTLGTYQLKHFQGPLMNWSFIIQLFFLAVMNFYWIYALSAIFWKNLTKLSKKDSFKVSGYVNNYDPNLLKAQTTALDSSKP